MVPGSHVPLPQLKGAVTIDVVLPPVKIGYTLVPVLSARHATAVMTAGAPVTLAQVAGASSPSWSTAVLAGLGLPNNTSQGWRRFSAFCACIFRYAPDELRTTKNKSDGDA